MRFDVRVVDLSYDANSNSIAPLCDIPPLKIPDLVAYLPPVRQTPTVA